MDLLCPLLRMPYWEGLGFKLAGNFPVVQSPRGESFSLCAMLPAAYDRGPAAPDPSRLAVYGDTSLAFGGADLDGG